MKSSARLLLCGAVIFLLEMGARAEESKAGPATASTISHSIQSTGEVIVPTAPLSPPSQAVSSGNGVQLAIYLCLLVALLGGGSYLLKNGAGFLRPKSKGARKLNVAETRMLGNRQFLVVAEYEGRRMLLGVCPGRIELLSELGSQTEDTFGVRLNESR